jgi:hypothetical protein
MWIIGGILNAVGANYIGDPNYITVSFRNRVQADGGVFEAQNCLVSFLNSLS